MHKRGLGVVVVLLIAAALVAGFLVGRTSGSPSPFFSPNITSANATRTCLDPCLPDLVIPSVSDTVLNQTNNGTTNLYNVRMNGVITNIGRAPTNELGYEYYVVGDSGGAGTYFPLVLAPGQNYKFYQPLGWRASGTYQVVVIADPFNEIPELNENNNNYTLTFTLR